MPIFNIIIGFFTNAKNWFLIGLIVFCIILLGMFSCERENRIKAENKAESERLISQALTGNLTEIFRDRNSKEHVLTTVIGVSDKNTMKQALEDLNIKLNGIHLKLDKVLLAQKTITNVDLPIIKQILKDSTPNESKHKTFKADTTNPYFQLFETIKMDIDSNCLIKNAFIQRERILISDTTNQYISLGKFKKRFLRIPFLKFNGIGISDPEILSETIHANPYIYTIEQNIILRNKK